MLLTHFIWQTDLKPLSGTNAKNGAITPSLILTIHTSHARCDKASEWVGGSLQCKRGILVILWMSLVGRIRHSTLSRSSLSSERFKKKST